MRTSNIFGIDQMFKKLEKRIERLEIGLLGMILGFFIYCIMQSL